MRFSQQIEAQIDALFTAYDRPDSPGFAAGILHVPRLRGPGEFLYKKGYGQANLEHPSPITARTVFDVGSMAKMFTGMAIALLEEAGQLAIDDRLRAYLPEFPAYADRVTLAHLLHHSSGIRNYTVLAYYMIGLHESDAATREQVDEILLNQTSLSFAPGAKWEYSDSNYYLLARIVERVTGQTLGRYAREALFAPLGMVDSRFRERHSDVIHNRALSYVRHPVAFRSPSDYRQGGPPCDAYHTLVSNYEHVGAEGAYSTLEDLARWARNLAHNQLGRGGPALIDRVLTPAHTERGARVSKDMGYGYGINVGTYRGKSFCSHDGAIHGYTSTLMHFPEEETTIICLTNQNILGAWEVRNRIMDLIFDDLAPSYTPAAPTARVPAAQARTVAGAYQDPETAAIWEIAPQDGGLEVTLNRTRSFGLFPLRPLAFRAADPSLEIELEFVLDESGAVLQVHGNQAGAPFTLKPFLQRPLGSGELAEYAGAYHCSELRTTFLVDVAENRLRLRNKDRHFCSMDLVYDPTIEDSFVAYDAHCGSSQITFLREGGHVRAFHYRDYDGDRREDFLFRKVVSGA